MFLHRYTIVVMEVVGQVRAMKLETSVTNKRRRVDSGDPILVPKSSHPNDPLPNQCCPKNSVSPTTTFEFPHQIPATSLCLKIQSVTSSSRSSDLKVKTRNAVHFSILRPNL